LMNGSIQIGPNVQQPGESTEAFAKRVGEIFEDKWSGIIEPAMSGVSR
jgi:hypothetical protein